MTRVGTAINAESVENVKQVVDVGMERGVALEVEVIGVDTAGADEVVENDSVVGHEVRQNALPRRLVRAKAVSEDQDFFPGAHHPDIKSFQQLVAHVSGLQRRN